MIGVGGYASLNPPYESGIRRNEYYYNKPIPGSDTMWMMAKGLAVLGHHSHCIASPPHSVNSKILKIPILTTARDQ